MGCANSRLEKQETVWRSRERKRLIKQLLICRSDLAASHTSYLRSLRNTGATLRQFTEAESHFSGDSSPRITLPPLPPPPPLPPSPPPPPQLTKEEGIVERDDRSIDVDVDTDGDDDESCKPPPPCIHTLDWDFWDPFGVPSDSNSSSPVMVRKDEEEEKWAEAMAEFEDEEKEMGCGGSGADMASAKEKEKEKETDASVAAWRRNKTLAGIVKEIDDYFLKAAAGGGDLLVLLESSHCQRLESNFKKTKGEFCSILID